MPRSRNTSSPRLIDTQQEGFSFTEPLTHEPATQFKPKPPPTAAEMLDRTALTVHLRQVALAITSEEITTADLLSAAGVTVYSGMRGMAAVDALVGLGGDWIASIPRVGLVVYRRRVQYRCSSCPIHVVFVDGRLCSACAAGPEAEVTLCPDCGLRKTRGGGRCDRCLDVEAEDLYNQD